MFTCLYALPEAFPLRYGVDFQPQFYEQNCVVSASMPSNINDKCDQVTTLLILQGRKAVGEPLTTLSLLPLHPPNLSPPCCCCPPRMAALSAGSPLTHSIVFLPTTITPVPSLAPRTSSSHPRLTVLLLPHTGDHLLTPFSHCISPQAPHSSNIAAAPTHGKPPPTSYSRCFRPQDHPLQDSRTDPTHRLSIHPPSLLFVAPRPTGSCVHHVP